MKQELVDLLQELEYLGKSGTHTFLLSVANDDMDTGMWERLQDLLKMINAKSQEAFLISASLRRETTITNH